MIYDQVSNDTWSYGNFVYFHWADALHISSTLDNMKIIDSKHTFFIILFKTLLSDYLMNVDHKAVLVDNYTYLQSNIMATESVLLDALLEAGVLDAQEVDEIRSKETKQRRNNELLNYIVRTSEEQYQQFLECLNRASHQHVYDKLTGRLFNLFSFKNSRHFLFLHFFLFKLLNLYFFTV